MFLHGFPHFLQANTEKTHFVPHHFLLFKATEPKSLYHQQRRQEHDKFTSKSRVTYILSSGGSLEENSYLERRKVGINHTEQAVKPTAFK
jgi:hypothetical protein